LYSSPSFVPSKNYWINLITCFKTSFST
jgi:hypothetical protein